MDCDLKSDISWNITDTALHTHLETTLTTFTQWIPTVLFVLGTPLRVFRFDQKSTYSPMYYFKLMIVMVTASMTLYLIGQSILDIVRGESMQHEKSLGAVIILSTMLMEVFKSHKQNYMRLNNRIFSIVWLFLVLGTLIMNKGGVLFYTGRDNAIQQLMFVLYVILVIIRLVESWYDDSSDGDISHDMLKEDISPESTASFLSWLTFDWMTPLIYKGYKKTLERNDLYPLSEENSSSKVIPHFEENWKKAEDRAKRKQRVLEQASPGLSAKDRTISTPQASLLYCLCRTYTPILLVSAFYQLLFNLTEFICPLVLKWLIANTRETSDHSWKGYIYAVLMFALTILKVFFIQHHVHKTQTAGRRSWVSLTSAIYKKTLRLSNASKNSTTVGEIINLMSNDARKIAECMWSVNDIWAVPLVFFLAFVVLWDTLGTAAFVGIIVILAFVPINVVLMKKSTTLHHEHVDLTDARIKTMNEVLNGIKVLKMYAWEEAFAKKILEIRDKELGMKQRRETIETWLHLIWSISPFMISFATFAAYVLMDASNVLTAEKAFVALALFHRIRWALGELPHIVNNFIQAKVSYGRIQTFLHCEELDDNIVSRPEDSIYGATIEDGAFYWNLNEDPILQNIDIKIPEGSLVAIVGAVGAGKSSLLSAILGEMESKSKSISIKGSVAYTGQEAWIMNTTLQKNILFGQELSEKKYEETIDATALRKDLEILAGGDQTEIGEKGINLSGGQKQRVSLARAIYQDADVYLLDDPLSAVDSHVGKHIFDNVIGSEGLLRDKTRILVTHGISFLPKVDMIITMVDGQIEEMGSFKELVEQNGAFAEFLRNYLLEEINSGEEINQALESTEEVAFQMAETGTSGLLKRQLSEIVTRKRTESEMSETFHHIKSSHTNDSYDYHLEHADPKTHISEASSQLGIGMDTKTQTSGGPSQPAVIVDFCDSNEHVDHLDEIYYHLDRRIYTDNDVFHSDKHFSRQLSSTSNASTSSKDVNQFSRQTSQSSNMESTKYSRITEDEKTQEGGVNLSVVMMYGGAIGLKLCILSLTMNTIHKIAEVYLDVWIGYWVSDYKTNGTMTSEQTNMRLLVYAIIGFIRGVLIFLTEICVTIALIKASKKIHKDLLHNILRSPMSFFDTTPIGRIVNRFSTDIDILDDQIIYQFKDSYMCSISLMCNVFVICTGTPQAIFIVIPVVMAYFYTQRIFASTFRQLRRLESAAKSPVFSHFGETLSGSSTIRAYRKQKRFISESAHRCNEVTTIRYLKTTARRWLDIRMEALGSLIVLCVCVLVVYGKDYLTPSLVGLCITNAISVTGCLEWFVKITSDLESNIVSVERIKEYSETPTEAARVIKDKRPKSNWPDKGCVEIKDYAVRYRDGLDLVLKGITCDIQKGQKIGIVGRTGAGKSSLTMGLFRLIERAHGSIIIDGIDISTIGLRDLRSKITIIPQDPVLFSGTMKMNLDPFEDYSDNDIWEALTHAHLRTFVKGLSGELEFMCAEGGENLSVGQRQLICLARALLRKTKILVLDEATAAVDLETDDLIQKTIREEFASCTILTIAHRLNTVLDYDRIMILDSGRISEFDTPSNLLNDINSVFHGMAKDAGLVA